MESIEDGLLVRVEISTRTRMTVVRRVGLHCTEAATQKSSLRHQRRSNATHRPSDAVRCGVGGRITFVSTNFNQRRCFDKCAVVAVIFFLSCDSLPGEARVQLIVTRFDVRANKARNKWITRQMT